jgi:uncharacterized phage-associated protein
MTSTVEIVKPKPHLAKIIESILAVIGYAQLQGHKPTQYDIVKTVFLADRSHLNKYGRPITYDQYFAMYHGPVASCTYDILKEKPFALKQVGSALPWKREQIDQFKFSYHTPSRIVDEDILSPSDVEELEAAYKIVSSLGFRKVRKLTHEDVAYTEAWRDEGGPNAAYPMAYGLLFDQPDFMRSKEIAFLSEHV